MVKDHCTYPHPTWLGDTHPGWIHLHQSITRPCSQQLAPDPHHRQSEIYESLVLVPAGADDKKMKEELKTVDRLEVPGLKQHFREEVETRIIKEKVNQRIKKIKTNDEQKPKKKGRGRKITIKAADKPGRRRQTCDSGVDNSCMEVRF